MLKEILPGKISKYSCLTLKKKILDLLEANINIFCKNDDDLGCVNHYEHKIELTNTNPIYVKQFQIVDAYHAGLFDQVKSWLALGGHQSLPK